VSGGNAGAKRPRRVAPDSLEPQASSFSPRDFLRTAAGKIAAVGLALSVASAGVVALVMTSSASATAHAAPEPTPVVTTPSLSDLAAERSQALTADANAIGAASQSVAAASRDRALTQDNLAIANEADRLKNLATFLWPTKGPVVSPFGMRFHPILHYTRLHDGVDIDAPCGQDVFAAQSGTVISADMGYNGGEGNNVHIDNGDINGDHIETGYLHLTSFIVKVGQQVNKGELIGKVGTTGLSTGCHLHLVLHKNGQPSDPLEYAKPTATAATPAPKS